VRPNGGADLGQYGLVGDGRNTADHRPAKLALGTAAVASHGGMRSLDGPELLWRGVYVILDETDGELYVVSVLEQHVARVVSSEPGELRVIGNPSVVWIRDRTKRLSKDAQFFSAGG
jgi:hypothetical protein